ncbi:MAG: FGGY family carbohydrate kinase [Treponema sp.]|nr:FGGY family carbohydrate kinase [Treponema sp.]
MDSYIIGVDNGTQSTKVMIFNQRGEVVAQESQPLRPMIHRQSGWVEHPDDDLWDSVKAVLKTVMGKFSGDKNRIVGLGLCTIRCCRVFMKKDGTLAEPVMSWMDVRSYAPFEDRDDIAYTCPTTGYVTYRLTGELKDTAANAFQWQFPIDVKTWDWSTDGKHFSSFKIPKEKLLKLQMPGTILGHVTVEAAAETGLPVGLPVVATGNDKAVEALGAGLVEKNTGLVSCGTYLAGMVHGDAYIDGGQNFWTNLSCVPHEYLYESSGIRYGMRHVSWFKEILGDEFGKTAEARGLSVEEYLAGEAADVPAGSGGLLVVPDWLAPATELHRKGLILGLTDLTKRSHIYKAILEGIVMTVSNNYNAMSGELGISPERVIISGGGSNSALMMQIFADCLGVPTVRNEVNGAVAMGSALCVAVATGLYGNFREAVAAMVKRRDEFTPNPANHKIYVRINEGIYRELPKLMENILKQAQMSEG